MPIVKATVSRVFEDFKFKMSEGLDQNWSCPDSAQLAVSVTHWFIVFPQSFWCEWKEQSGHQWIVENQTGKWYSEKDATFKMGNIK